MLCIPFTCNLFCSIACDKCRSVQKLQPKTSVRYLYTANTFKVAAGVFWFLNLLKGEVPHGLSWEGVVPVEHIRGSCSHRGLVLSSEIHFLCLQSLSSLSAIPEPVTVVSFVIPNSFYRTSLYNGQLRPSRRLHTAVK